MTMVPGATLYLEGRLPVIVLARPDPHGLVRVQDGRERVVVPAVLLRVEPAREECKRDGG